MRVRSWVRWLAVAVAMAGGAAMATDDADKPVCLEETQRLCPIVPVGLVQACLQAHVDELSPECRRHVSEVNDDIGRLDRNCQPDVDRFCAQPQTAAGQRVACLVEHRNDLSDACRRTIDALSGRRATPTESAPAEAAPAEEAPAEP